MKDENKTKAQLIAELVSLRQQVEELETPPLDVVPSRQLLAALRSLNKGRLPQRLPTDQIGIAGEISESFNEAGRIDCPCLVDHNF